MGAMEAPDRPPLAVCFAGGGTFGIAYLLGFAAAAGLLVLYHRRGRSPLNLNAVTDLITAIVFGVLLGGRIGRPHGQQAASRQLAQLAVGAQHGQGADEAGGVVVEGGGHRGR